MCGGCGPVQRIVHGIKGQAKYRLGVGLAPARVIEARRVICRACSRAVPCKLKPELKCKCGVCGCPLRELTSLASESCPLPDPKWLAYQKEITMPDEPGPEWVHLAIESLDSIIADVEANANPAKILERLRDELRPLVVELSQLDPRDGG